MTYLKCTDSLMSIKGDEASIARCIRQHSLLGRGGLRLRFRKLGHVNGRIVLHLQNADRRARGHCGARSSWNHANPEGNLHAAASVAVVVIVHFVGTVAKRGG